MTTAEKNEINDRIAKLRSSQAAGCKHCDKGVVYAETDSWGIVFKRCPNCSEEKAE